MRHIAVLFMLFGVSECSVQCLMCNNASLFNLTRFGSSLPMSCPPHSSIYAEGASSIDNCTCDEGFIGSSGNCSSNATKTTPSSSDNIPLIAGVAAAATVVALAALTGFYRWASRPVLPQTMPVPPQPMPATPSNNMFWGVKITPGRIPR
jgi:hypothetical protein